MLPAEDPAESLLGVSDLSDLLHLIGRNPDEVGVLALYVAAMDGVLCFSTDLRVIVRCMDSASLDAQAASEFLHYLYYPAPRTMISGAHAVLPGHALTFEDMRHKQEKVSKGRFQVVNSLPQGTNIDSEIERHLPKFEELLLSAVEDCLPRQGNIGLTLSGGKDSSVLAVALKKLCPDRVIAMTVGQKNTEFDESSDAARVCEHLGLLHRIYAPSDGELVDGLDDFFRAQDQPIGDPSALPYFLGMRQLREDCDVLLDGTGNDYYFGISSEDRGKWLFQRRLQLQRIMPTSVWKLMLATMLAAGGGMRRLAKAWSEPIEETFVPWNGWSNAEICKIFNSEVSFSKTYMWEFMNEALYDDAINVETNSICGIWEPNSPFRKSLNLANSLGMQTRFPFIDQRLAEFVQSLPIELRNYRGVNKVLMRKYMEQNLPISIVQKPKKGFVFDLARVLRSYEIKLSADAMKVAKFLELDDDGTNIVCRTFSEYQDANGNSDAEHRVYSAWLLAKVIDANYAIAETLNTE